MKTNQKATHFGFQSVAWEDKEKKVSQVFSSVASQYDLMNDLMSAGIHRLWKRYTIELSQVRKGDQILDLAGGSGDLTRLLSQKTGPKGCVYLADINAEMLSVGRDKLLNLGLAGNIRFVQANAECLPFQDNQFDCMTMGFGLRNVTDKDKALASLYRVCKPGGKVMILEFSQPTIPGLKAVYDWYSFALLPKLGQWIANDGDSYRYLAESIRMHPDQESLKDMMATAGFEDCRYVNLTGGIVALHIGYKY